jgi:tetratricopeptide (TPR) repeat protein
MFFSSKNKLAAVMIGCSVLAISPQSVMARILEEIQVQPDNYENVVSLQFNAQIQFLRAVPVGKSNSILVYFRLLQSDDLKEIKSVETLKSKAFDPLPGVAVSYAPQSTQDQTLTLLIGKDKLPANVKVRAGPNDHSVFIIFGDKPIKHTFVSDSKRYALTLMRSANKDELSGKVISREFQDYDVFTSQQTRDGNVLYELNLGYFASPKRAEQVRAKLLSQFPETEVTDLLKRRQDMLAAASARARAEPGQAQAQAPLPEVADQAAAIMPKAQEALNAANYELAINSFNQILLLPPNKYSQEAQELIGLARERNGELAKAKAEYDLYLKLFPEGPGADRVRQQLAQLKVPAPGARKVKARDATVVKSVTGSFSQFYYGGQTQTQTAFNTPTTSGTASLTSTDQSELRSQLDLKGLYRDADADQKLVFRADDSRSFIDTRPNRTRILSAYYEYKGYQNGFTAKVGRQTPTSGGVLGRFDGALLGYEFAPKWRANFVAGLPVDFPSLQTDRKFWGVSLDADNLTERLRAKTYFIDQTADGIVDRRAVGLEAGLYDARGSISSLLDYDVSYRALNIGTLQSNWQTEGGSSFNFGLDYRRSPPLSTTVALYNIAVTSMLPIPTSIKQLLQTNSEDQIRAWARDSSAISRSVTAGFLTPLNKAWQLGGDFSLSNTGALPGQTLDDGTVIPPTPATGNIYTYSLRAIGSSLLTSNDVNVFSVSLNQGDTYHGELFVYNNTTRLGRWTLEPSLKYYQQKTDPTTDLVRWTPEIRLTYLWKDNLSLEMDYTFEYGATTTSPGNKDVSQQHFFYVGYRWDI